MINDLTDEIFWIFTIGCCILFIMRLLSPPPRHKVDQKQDLNTLRPRRVHAVAAFRHWTKTRPSSHIKFQSAIRRELYSLNRNCRVCFPAYTG
ncbi:hypothetical protein F9K83_17745 [Brucella anthropi]|nr:hypothetical protein F9K76_19595 [Brucella anthropi]KAB2739550.1 hypothetical protein F9K74_17750 [Brucella anthropi]KAB2801909.1 hypothetical protein F9K83_17745 [Brucella anthropi]